ncbi:hypothetical protein [Paludisphaera mucosa]|uniref:Response regulatory domain-containing protein n=1 Tax=Paludisphaera mucosa TaxID=3030827 RepID=A0ABT6F6W2_9BACT|nr:hypothetical protein [Paludisphaera mucosa]MDG3003130.1 hypothetical protein [Paludisphaera mucosa]
MKGITILTITKDSDWLIRMRPALHAAGRGRLVVAESIAEAERLLAYAKPRLIVVDWKRSQCSSDDVAPLLWKNSTQARPASVMILAQDYQVEEATVLYQLGVDEYVSDSDHHDVLGSVLSAHSPESSAIAGHHWRSSTTTSPALTDAGDARSSFEPIGTAR